MKGFVRYKVEDGVEFCWCSGHKEYLPCEGFGANSRNKSGKHNYCKECVRMNDRKQKGEPIPFGTVNQFVENQKNNILKNLGYDLEGDVSIHQQFLKKHKL